VPIFAQTGIWRCKVSSFIVVNDSTFYYYRTFTQVSVNWPDTEQMREELDDLQIFLSTRWTILLNLQQEIFRVNGVEDIIQVLILFTLECLESDRVLLYSERHSLLRVLPVLVVLATSGEKEGESIFKKIKISRLMSIFKRDPVIPAFPDLHLAPASMLKELAPYFHRLTAQMRFIGLPLPHEITAKDAMEYQPEAILCECLFINRFLCMHVAFL
jgi:cytoplasmic FMR1 interacting protein